ncbi:MAG: NHL repeat-containing protein [bacterium]
MFIQKGEFLIISDKFGPGFLKTEYSCGLTSGVAEAEQVDNKILWHSEGMTDDKLNRPQGCCLDPDSSLIYVADTENNRVIIFTSDGEYLGPFLTSRPVKRPFDLIFGPDSLIYITQLEEKSIEVFNKKGVWQTSIPRNSRRKEFELKPGRMIFDRNGRLLVNDRGSGEVWFMTREGKVLKKQSVGQKDKASGLLSGIALDTKGRIYVVSAQGSPVITVLDADGSQINSFGRHGSLYEDSLSFPHSLAVDNKDRIWVVDAFGHTIKVFSPDGTYLFKIGEFGEEAGAFVYPVDIDIDKDGRLYVLEKGTGRLQALSVIFQGTEGLE